MVLKRRKLDLADLAQLENVMAKVNNNEINVEDIATALVELGELLSEQDDAIVELAEILSEGE